MAAELPARAVRDFAEIADADPRAVLLDDWISAVGWLAGAGHYDDANALLAVARSHVAADATDRLDALARAIEIYRLRFPPSDGLIDARPKWEGTEFVASSEFAPLCTLATTSSTDAYKRYLDVARDRALSADDYGALALALYRAGDRERARWVMWNASLDHGGDARIVDFADFLRCGGNRDLLELRAICDY
ncbi:MAG: hypothetical protein K8S98_18645 [Planctomycetes bacterium]|nr:hypothetical protein [Planctomycetota bacterium]